MRKPERSKTGGFTLVELMIVIAIIAILASIAIPQYLKYQRKAKVSSYALPIARACAMDMASACIEHPGTTVTVNETSAPSCYNNGSNVFQTAGGNVTLTPIESITCNNDGSIGTSEELVSAEITSPRISDFKASCEYKDNSIKCIVAGS